VPIVDPIPYRPWLDRGHVVDGSFRWRLGARPLDLHDWIELGPDAEGPDGWIAQKSVVMARHATTAFAVMADIEPECDEIAVALVEHLRSRRPELYRDVTLGVGRHPLDAAARLVPEDLVVMVEREGRLVFGGGSVCFPNRWDLVSKLGAPIGAVHAPVARLNEQLEHAVDGFFERLRPERSFWRLGWGILDTADGYTPLDGTAAPRPERPTIDDLHVRVERETLRRFPRTNAVLFTIRTYVSPLRSVIADPENRSAIATIVDAMPSDVRGYKDITDAMRAAVG
jgi:dimethylamine monooxygenase subunit A